MQVRGATRVPHPRAWALRALPEPGLAYTRRSPSPHPDGRFPALQCLCCTFSCTLEGGPLWVPGTRKLFGVFLASGCAPAVISQRVRPRAGDWTCTSAVTTLDPQPPAPPGNSLFLPFLAFVHGHSHSHIKNKNKIEIYKMNVTGYQVGDLIARSKVPSNGLSSHLNVPPSWRTPQAQKELPPN